MNDKNSGTAVATPPAPPAAKAVSTEASTAIPATKTEVKPAAPVAPKATPKVIKTRKPKKVVKAIKKSIKPRKTKKAVKNKGKAKVAKAKKFYSPKSAYGKISRALLGKTFKSHDDMLKAAAKASKKGRRLVTFDTRVLYSPNHSSNRGRTGNEFDGRKDKKWRLKAYMSVK